MHRASVIRVMSPRLFTAILLLIIPLVSCKEYIDSRAIKIFNNSILVENIECDSRKDYHDCDDFTSFHIYAFAAKIPPSGAGGYITDEPQFACSHVEPPKNNTIEWAALVYYSTMSCDCSYEDKILHVQAAGYKIALLMERRNCSDDIGNNDTNVTDITIPAVLLSQTVGLSLLSYSSPTDDAEPTGSVIVEAHYVNDYATIMLIVIGCAGFLILATIACLWSCRCFRKHKRRLVIGSEPYETLPETKSKNLSKPSDDTESNDTETEELPELTFSQASHGSISLQKINNDKQQNNSYGTVLGGSATHTNGNTLEPQLKLQVGDNQFSYNKI